jgi:glycerol uptake facilitator-like aquaporin
MRRARRVRLERLPGATYSEAIDNAAHPQETTMTHRTAPRLSALACAFVMTFALFAGIDALATVDAAPAHFANAAPAQPATNG